VGAAVVPLMGAYQGLVTPLPMHPVPSSGQSLVGLTGGVVAYQANPDAPTGFTHPPHTSMPQPLVVGASTGVLLPAPGMPGLGDPVTWIGAGAPTLLQGPGGTRADAPSPAGNPPLSQSGSHLPRSQGGSLPGSRPVSPLAPVAGIPTTSSGEQAKPQPMRKSRPPSIHRSAEGVNVLERQSSGGNLDYPDRAVTPPSACDTPVGGIPPSNLSMMDLHPYLAGIRNALLANYTQSLNTALFTLQCRIVELEREKNELERELNVSRQQVAQLTAGTGGMGGVSKGGSKNGTKAGRSASMVADKAVKRKLHGQRPMSLNLEKELQTGTGTSRGPTPLYGVPSQVYAPVTAHDMNMRLQQRLMQTRQHTQPPPGSMENTPRAQPHMSHPIPRKAGEPVMLHHHKGLAPGAVHPGGKNSAPGSTIGGGGMGAALSQRTHTSQQGGAPPRWGRRAAAAAGGSSIPSGGTMAAQMNGQPVNLSPEKAVGGGRAMGSMTPHSMSLESRGRNQPADNNAAAASPAAKAGGEAQRSPERASVVSPVTVGDQPVGFATGTQAGSAAATPAATPKVPETPGGTPARDVAEIGTGADVRISGPGVGEVAEGEKPTPILTLLAKAHRNKGERFHKLPISAANDNHTKLLQRVWDFLFPEKPMRLVADEWLMVGFISGDPVAELNRSRWGYICLHNLYFIVTNIPTITKTVLLKRKRKLKLANVVILLTKKCIKMLDITEGQNSVAYSALRENYEEPLREVCQVAVLVFDRLWWTHRKSMGWDDIVEMACSQVQEYLKTHPKDLDTLYNSVMDDEDDSG